MSDSDEDHISVSGLDDVDDIQQQVLAKVTKEALHKKIVEIDSKSFSSKSPIKKRRQERDADESTTPSPPARNESPSPRRHNASDERGRPVQRLAPPPAPPAIKGYQPLKNDRKPVSVNLAFRKELSPPARMKTDPKSKASLSARELLEKRQREIEEAKEQERLEELRLAEKKRKRIKRIKTKERFRRSTASGQIDANRMPLASRRVTTLKAKPENDSDTSLPPPPVAPMFGDDNQRHRKKSSDGDKRHLRSGKREKSRREGKKRRKDKVRDKSRSPRERRPVSEDSPRTKDRKQRAEPDKMSRSPSEHFEQSDQGDGDAASASDNDIELRNQLLASQMRRTKRRTSPIITTQKTENDNSGSQKAEDDDLDELLGEAPAIDQRGGLADLYESMTAQDKKVESDGEGRAKSASTSASFEGISVDKLRENKNESWHRSRGGEDKKEHARKRSNERRLRRSPSPVPPRRRRHSPFTPPRKKLHSPTLQRKRRHSPTPPRKRRRSPPTPTRRRQSPPWVRSRDKMPSTSRRRPATPPPSQPRKTSPIGPRNMMAPGRARRPFSETLVMRRVPTSIPVFNKGVLGIDMYREPISKITKYVWTQLYRAMQQTETILTEQKGLHRAQGIAERAAPAYHRLKTPPMPIHEGAQPVSSMSNESIMPTAITSNSSVYANKNEWKDHDQITGKNVERSIDDDKRVEKKSSEKGKREHSRSPHISRSHNVNRRSSRDSPPRRHLSSKKRYSKSPSTKRRRSHSEDRRKILNTSERLKEIARNIGMPLPTSASSPKKASTNERVLKLMKDGQEVVLEQAGPIVDIRAEDLKNIIVPNYFKERTPESSTAVPTESNLTPIAVQDLANDDAGHLRADIEERRRHEAKRKSERAPRPPELKWEHKPQPPSPPRNVRHRSESKKKEDEIKLTQPQEFLNRVKMRQERAQERDNNRRERRDDKSSKHTPVHHSRHREEPEPNRKNDRSSISKQTDAMSTGSVLARISSKKKECTNTAIDDLNESSDALNVSDILNVCDALNGSDAATSTRRVERVVKPIDTVELSDTVSTDTGTQQQSPPKRPKIVFDLLTDEPTSSKAPRIKRLKAERREEKQIVTSHNVDRHKLSFKVQNDSKARKLDNFKIKIRND